MTRLGTLLAALLLTLLAGCGGGEEAAPEAEPSEETSDSSGSTESEEPGEAAEELDCGSLLSDDDAAKLVGEDVGTAQQGRAGAIPACQWGAPTAGVQVIDLPADEWIEQLPALIGEVEASGVKITPAQQDRLDEGVELAESAEGATPDEACEVFSTMAEIQGEQPGSDSLVTLIPTRQEPAVVSAQSCVEGRFQSVTFGKPDLASEVDAAIGAAQDALATVQENAG